MVGSFAEVVAGFAAQARTRTESALTETAVEAGARLSERSPVRTGRFRGAWRLVRDGEGDVRWRNDTPYGPELEARRHFVARTQAELPAIIAAATQHANKS